MSKANCQRRGCGKTRSELSLLLSRRRVPLYNGEYYCSAGCLETQMQMDLASRWKGIQQERDRRLPRPRLGAILLNTTTITADQLKEAVGQQREAQQGKLGEWLIRLGFAEEHQVTMALSRQFGLPLLKLSDSDVRPSASTLIPGKVAKASGVLAVSYDEQNSAVRLAVTAPIYAGLQEGFRRMLGTNVIAYLGDASAIERLIELWYEPEETDLSGCGAFASLSELREIVSSVIRTSVDHRADNLQSELFEGCLWVRVDWAGRSEHACYSGTVQNAMNAACVPVPRLAYAANL
jgi:hypothetical protein